jgi:hypothetical protein
MASQGKMSHNEQPDIPVVSRQDMSSESYQDASPVETTNDASYEVEEFRVPSTYEETPNSTNWQEVLRQQRPEEILMEMGYDEDSVHLMQELKDVDPKMVQILTNWKNDGDSVVEYLKELVTDYAEMPSEEVMRRQLREEYPKASDRQLDILYRKEIVEKYNLDSMDEELVEEGKLLLDVRADSYREKLVQQQQEKLLPKYEKKVDDTEIRAQEEFSSYKSNLLQDNLTRSLLETSVLSIGEGDDKFNYRIGDPQDVVNSLLDSETWAAKLFDVQVDSNGSEKYVPNISLLR